MLSITRVSSGQAGTYYSQDDYYLESGQSEWYGKGANNLGLNGIVTEASFLKLTLGKSPGDEFSIANGGKEYKHTAGVDLTFSAPKSVSIAGLVLDDKRILEAHNTAVNETMGYIENNLMQVRLKVEGKLLSENTNNLIAAKFQHVASRELDPQLHTHCLVFNASQKNNGDWRAVNYKSIFDNKLMLGQVYRNELAKNLQELGYKIETDNRGFFELKGVDASLLQAFSARSEQIKARLEKLRSKYPNANEAELKAMATLDSRKAKDEPSFSKLKFQWDTRLNEYGIDKQNLREQMIDKSSLTLSEARPDIDKIVSEAIKICTATEAVVSKETILKTAIKNNMVGYSARDFESALINNKEVKSYLDNRYFTTKDIAAQETNIVQNIKSQQNTQPRILDKESIADGIVNYELRRGFKLTSDQKQAVEHILNSRDQVIAIQGDAGTGKTTMLDCVNDIINVQNINMDLRGLSFTGKAAHEIEQASNIKSQTLARFIYEKDDLRASSMFIVDEASMLSIKDMSALLDKVGSNDRVVLIGDTKQLQSIGAGKVFTTLQDEKAINTVNMKESKRQVTEIYKESTKKMAEKLTGQSVDILNEHGKIVEIRNREDRQNAIVEKYCKNPENTILVTATNADRQELNSKIRSELRAQGKIADNNVGLLVRESKGLTEEQKISCQNYSKNDLVIVNSDSFGKAGFEGNITDIDKEKNTIAILDKNMNTYEINLSQYGSDISVYKERLNEFTAGEKIVFLKNDKGLGVSNGQTAKIQGIEHNGKAKLLMESGQEKVINLKTQYKYIAHGYALTDYKAQGQTAREVIYHADTTKSVNFNRAYVGITRGKEDIAIYTDDKAKFKEMASKDQQKTAVHEFEAQEKNMRASQRQQISRAQEKHHHHLSY